MAKELSINLTLGSAVSILSIFSPSFFLPTIETEGKIISLFESIKVPTKSSNETLSPIPKYFESTLNPSFIFFEFKDSNGVTILSTSSAVESFAIKTEVCFLNSTPLKNISKTSDIPLFAKSSPIIKVCT